MSGFKTRKIQNCKSVIGKPKEEPKPFVLEDKQEVSIVTKFSAVYTNDYNIKRMDSMMKRALANENTEDREKELSVLRNKVQQAESYISRMSNNKRIDVLVGELEDIKSGKKLNRYIEETQDLIKRYSELGPYKRSSICNNNVLTATDKERLYLIESYISIAGNYMDVDINQLVTENNILCVGCGANMSEAIASEEGLVVCDICDTEYYVAITNKTVSDNSRFSNCINTDNETLENFMKAFWQLQGLEGDAPSNKILDELEHYFKSHGLPTRDEVIEKGIMTSRTMLRSALSRMDRSDCYDHVNYIGEQYWGWKLPKIAEYADVISENYLLAQTMWNRIPVAEKDRSSSLGIQYHLYRQVQILGLDPNVEHYSIVENEKSFRNHERNWKRICEMCREEGYPHMVYMKFK